jgi:uncharacterized protein involved in exopolysaccharide biosynthesis
MENFLYKPETIKKIDKQEKLNKQIIRVTGIISELWKNRKTIFLVNLIGGVLAVLCLMFLVKSYYESTIVILPEFGSKSTTLGGLSDLASMAGVNLGDGSPTDIYENLVTSEAILGDVIYKKYETEAFPQPVNLIDYFEIEGDDADSPQKAARTQFLYAYQDLTKHRIQTNVDKLTKILTVTVRMPESELSADVANTMVESLDNYIRTKRKSFASQQSFYIEKRIKQVADSLKTAEIDLKNFQEKNKVVDQSPKLFLERARLMRNVDIQQGVYLELTKQLEISKIDEIKDTPIINNREDAKDPVIKAGPSKLLILIIIMFLLFSSTCSYFIYQSKIESYLNLIKKNFKN